MTKKKLFIFILVIIFVFTLSGCSGDGRKLEGTYQDNNNSNIIGWDDVDSGSFTNWDNVDIQTWSEIDEVDQWVRSQLLFENITDQSAEITSTVLDYKANGIYFDGDRVNKLVGKEFDLNHLIAKFAIGTGVIVVTIVLNVVTAGASTTIACVIAGACDGAISGAISGAGFGAAIGAVTSYIKSDGDWDETLYGTVDGGTSGYMWGAIFGAVTGSLNSNYCFTSDTQVLTANGLTNIENVKQGDYIYSFNEDTNKYSYQLVTQKTVSNAYETVSVYTDNGVVESTLNHPFLTKCGWTEAQDILVGQKLISTNGSYNIVDKVIVNKYSKAVKTYNMAINNNHTYLVGEDLLVVHNQCNINSKYSDKTYEFEAGSSMATKYPKGVKFSSNGYPDFSPYAKKTLSFEYPSAQGLKNGTCLNGNYNHDFALANRMAGYGDLPSSTPVGFTWHHDASMQKLLLIPQDIHRAIRHTGGASLIKLLLGGL